MTRYIGRLTTLLLLLMTVFACSKPAKIEITPAKVVLEEPGATQQLQAKVFDADGALIPDARVVWFSTDTKLIKLSQDGEVSAIASGEANVEVEVVNSPIKASVPIRVKIPSSIHVSHEKLRLWIGQVKDNVWAEVHSEKGAFVEGYLPSWTSDDPTIVKVEPIVDAKRRQSWVKMTGLKSGVTYINASFRGITKTIRVGVFGEEEEVDLSGQRIEKKKAS